MEIKPATLLKLKDLTDLIRMVVTWVGRDRTASLFFFRHEGKKIFAAFTLTAGYYDMQALPLFVYVESEEDPGDASFIKYKTVPKEEFGFCEGTEDPKFKYIPIVRIETVPPFVELP